MDLLLLPLSLLVLANAIYYGLTLISIFSFARRTEPQAADYPRVSILKAVRGLDPQASQALSSFLELDYPRPYQVVFALADANDPALPLIRRLIAEKHPHVSARVVIAPPGGGPNEKMSNLAAAIPHADGELIALGDADVLARPDWLRRMAAPFADPRVGLTTCLYRAGTAPGLWSRLEALTIASDLMPQVLVAERLEGISFGLGASICVHRAALAGIGGFEGLAPFLADDYLLGNRVHRAGWKLVLVPQVVELLFERQTARGYFLHQLRWARTYRACRPAGYAASAITHGVVWGPLFLMATGFFSALGWGVLGGLAALRVACYLTADRLCLHGGRRLSGLALLPFKDLVAFAVFVASFLGRRVTWRDRTFGLDGEGRLIQP
ncbi:MAG: bacteriohopanetetrol glucosamine biosynthesis glycosyltransferase HpnI [Pseudomonadota bacterium]